MPENCFKQKFDYSIIFSFKPIKLLTIHFLTASGKWYSSRALNVEFCYLLHTSYLILIGFYTFFTAIIIHIEILFFIFLQFKSLRSVIFLKWFLKRKLLCSPRLHFLMKNTVENIVYYYNYSSL